MEKIKTIIIDDEPDATDFLSLVINENCPQLDVCGISNTAIDAIKMIKRKRPELVLLDIEMPDATGFDILESIPNINFKVIFITAYNQHAIKAFKYSAFDYILKPIDVDELVNSIHNVSTIIRSGKNIPDLQVLMKNLQTSEPLFIAVPTGSTIDYIEIKKIIRIEADKRYSIIHTTQKKYVITKSIGEYEELLKTQDFIRVHNSHLINMKKVKSYIKKDGGYIIMNDDSKIMVSRRNKDSFVAAMDKFLA